ncbi:hypothetical protein OC71_09285, partial [Pseudomonas sp. W15Feb9B]
PPPPPRGGQQLTGVGVPALPGSPVANGGSEQMRLEETIAHHEIIGVRQAVLVFRNTKCSLSFLASGF